MKLVHFLAAPVLLLAVPSTAYAQQFEAVPDIESDDGEGFSYFGDDPRLGFSNDGGSDAFDDYGFLSGVRNLTVFRQTELFQSQNLFRFYDTFTNNTNAIIRTTINFSGELGSDSDTEIVASEDGLLVTCQGVDDGFGCESDPVIAHVFSNKGFGLATVGGEDDSDPYNALFRLVLNPGQSASLLNFAFLASEEAGTSAADIDLAISRGAQLQANPFVTGLSAEQRARIVNFDVPAIAAAVPEPASWAMMIGGFGMVGDSLRRTRRRATPALA